MGSSWKFLVLGPHGLASPCSLGVLSAWSSVRFQGFKVPTPQRSVAVCCWLPAPRSHTGREPSCRRTVGWGSSASHVCAARSCGVRSGQHPAAVWSHWGSWLLLRKPKLTVLELLPQSFSIQAWILSGVLTVKLQLAQ